MSVLCDEQPTSLSKIDFERMIGQCFIIWNARTQDVAFKGTILDVVHTSKQTFLVATPSDPVYRKTVELDQDDPRYDEHYIVAGETEHTVWLDLDNALGKDPRFKHFSGHKVAGSYK